MQYQKLKLCILLFIGLGLTGLQAQEAIPTSGGNASGSNGSVSYSVGQVVYTTNTGINGSAAQGVQQPYEISVITGIEGTNGINLVLLAYPNPTTNNLVLTVNNYDISALSVKLLDLNGRILMEKTMLESNETSIDMSNYAVGAFILVISEGKKKLKTFKIIKHL